MLLLGNIYAFPKQKVPPPLNNIKKDAFLSLDILLLYHEIPVWDFFYISLAISFPSLLLHSLHEPTYKFGIGNPAWSRAKIVWHAVTPEPQ